MMTMSLFTGERGEKVFSEAQLPAVLAKGGWLLPYDFLLRGKLYEGVSSASRHPVRPFCLAGLAYRRTPCHLCCRRDYHPSLGY
jgi:hypothetical protein